MFCWQRFFICVFAFSIDQGKKKATVVSSEGKMEAGDVEETVVEPNRVASTTDAGDARDEEDVEKVAEDEMLLKNGGEDEDEEDNEEGAENSMEEEEEEVREEAKEDEEKELNNAKMSEDLKLEEGEQMEVVCPDVNGQLSAVENGDLQGTSSLGSEESSGE